MCPSIWGAGQGKSETICDEAAEGNGNTNVIRSLYGYNINVCPWTLFWHPISDLCWQLWHIIWNIFKTSDYHVYNSCVLYTNWKETSLECVYSTNIWSIIMLNLVNVLVKNLTLWLPDWQYYIANISDISSLYVMLLITGCSLLSL